VSIAHSLISVCFLYIWPVAMFYPLRLFSGFLSLCICLDVLDLFANVDFMALEPEHADLESYFASFDPNSV
jgi:hypothetical protein